VIFAEHTLVEAGTTRALQLVPDPVTGLSQVHISMSSSTMDITSTLDSGELGATLQLRDTVIPGVLADLDALAFNVATEVNTLHAAGFGLDGVTGRNFFVPPALLAGSALALELDPAVIDTPDALAAATTPAGVPGDNSNATALAALSGTLIMSAGTQTFNSFWATALSSLGHDSATAQNDQLRAEIELSTALDVRDSASGVVLEEEALDLLRYQDAYQAATRIMSATQEMLDELLQMV